MSVINMLLFGKPTILYDGQPLEFSVKKAVALLAYLVTTGKPHSRERVAVLLWSDASEEVARTSLRQAIRALRETPIGAFVLTDRTSIELDAGVESDVRAFQTYFEQTLAQTKIVFIHLSMGLSSKSTNLNPRNT